MAANPAATATLYIAGHARAYHGHQTKLPRHYIALERLCLRATTDYWVNGLDGHQAAIISADRQAGAAQIAAPQFGR